VGISPFTAQRIFKQAMGVSPAQYQRAIRANAFRSQLRDGREDGQTNVTTAIYEAGYGSSSRAYEPSPLGMTPGKFLTGGRGEKIGFAVAKSSNPSGLGWIIVAGTARGVCWLALQAGAAGGLDGLAVDPDGVVGGEEGGDAGDVAGLADAAERGRASHFLLEVAADEAGGVDAFGLDHAGVERVDANLAGSELLRERAGDGVHRALGGAVDEAVPRPSAATEPMLMMLPPLGLKWVSAACVVSSRPSTLTLNCLWKCSGVTASMGLNS
jgi:hypothetical protein